ncbi:prolipoprotein diacylglyceryl transferase family protein [uncultured Akkermansia sp.]|uniref:prolipoprotein diacylglyceryl transferase family protein n=1 Tax=uncultured Akkermansia sp. TaxID=512294 RepID=UPI0026DB3C1D|nr:prolipoprotein diacylglyceryl transferase family protein [uncultured Akkermansia sp.]
MIQFFKKLLSGRCFYAFVFCVFIPCLLWSGARAWEPFMKLEPIHSTAAGMTAVLAGAILMGGSMMALKKQGGGLPMNAFPPPRFVSSGFYGLVPHPIYVGFCLACAGISLWTGSAAGLYVMTPLAVMGCLAIVWGYERLDLIRRFGTSAPPTLAGLPPNTDEPAGWHRRCTGLVLIGAFWAAAYYGGALTRVTEGAPDCRVFGESGNVVSESAVWVYQSIYIIVPLVLLFFSNTCRRLRRMEVMVYGCFGLGLFLFLMIPFSCPLKEFQPETLAGHALLLDRRELPDCCVAFPSFHVLWALITAFFLWRDVSRPAGIAAFFWAAALAWSCVATGMHGWLDVLGALGVFLLVAGYRRTAAFLLKLAERLANSWTSWRFGPYRIINHAVYVFLAAFFGYVLSTALAGEAYGGAVAVVALCSLAGAGLWAQIVEGSSRLLRPFGYYGSVLGGLAGVALAAVLQPLMSPGEPFNGWVLFGAMAVSSPWVQAIGRLRCLVQGCCHGHPVSPEHASWGIVHENPASRVCRLTEWRGIPLHPTPLYSIGFNLLSGWILVRLWYGGMPAGLLIGLYFMLSGLSRFVEEAYRGEPQTLRHAGLSDYQWLSVGFAGLAFVFWNIPSSMIPVPAPEWHVSSLLPGVLLGLLYAFCMSTDFPDSNKRFARLTS